MRIKVKQNGKIYEVKLLKDNGSYVTVKGISGNVVDIAKEDVIG